MLFHSTAGGPAKTTEVKELYEQAVGTLTENYVPVPVDALLLADSHAAVRTELESQVTAHEVAAMCVSVRVCVRFGV